MSENGQNNKMGLIAFLAVCGIWGSNFLATRILVISLPPLLVSGTRFVFAGLFILFFLLLRGNFFSLNKLEVKKTIKVGLLTIVGCNGLFVYGMQWVSSGEAALLTTTIPLFIGLIQIIVPGSHKISSISWLGLIIGFSGVAVLVAGDYEGQYFTLVGSGVILAASFMWALGSVYYKQSQGQTNVLATTGVQMVVGGMGQIFIGLLLGEAKMISTISPKFAEITAYLYLLFFGGIIGYIAYNYLLQVWPAEKAGTYAYVTPVVALFLGAAFLGEPLTTKKIGATLIILLGLYLVQVSGKQEVSHSEN